MTKDAQPQASLPTSRRRLLVQLALWVLAVVALVDLLLPRRGPTNAHANWLSMEVIELRTTVQAAMLANRSPLSASELNSARRLAFLAEKYPGASMVVLPPGQPRITPFSSEALVVACTAAYADSPRKAFWNLWLAAPKHTVGFADGSIRLLTEEEFASLDLTGFVPLREWLVTLGT